MKPYTLGLNIGKVDPSATLFEGTRIVAHVEEERFSRKKKGINQFPTQAIRYCLSIIDKEGKGLNSVASINLGFDFSKFTLDVPQYYIQEWGNYPDKPPQSARYEIDRLKKKNPEYVRAQIIEEFTKAGLVSGEFPKINWYTHHYCHALSSHLTSPFDDSLGIVVDANSEIDTLSVWNCRGSKLDKIYSKPLPHSLGWLYRAFTLFCGFDAYEGEGMLMGLAPYGKSNPVLEKKIEQVLQWRTNNDGEFEFDIDAEYIHLGKRSSLNSALTEKLISVFGEPAPQGVEMPNQYYRDIAHAIQSRFEQTLVRFVERFVTKTGHKYVTLSGGVFLNCKVNGRIWSAIDSIKDIYIISTSSDDGIGIGANMAYSVENISLKRSDYSMQNVYVGPEYSNEQIKDAISGFSLQRLFKNDAQYKALSNTLGIDSARAREMLTDGVENEVINSIVSDHLDKKCEFVENLTPYIAGKIAKGKIIAWFQGRMEAGPRALGNRSILADPRKIESLLKVNTKVKFRQSWRPFCPSVMDEYKDLYFVKSTQSPYMINTFRVTPLTKEAAPAIVHIDETARPQFLVKEQNPLFHSLLEEFHKLSKVPIFLNTSMNIKGEPMCCSPIDAINFYFATDVDV